MATWDDVREIALALPETTEEGLYGQPSWRVRKKLVVWDRPLRKRDLEELGDAAPDGPILGAKVEHEVAKQALLASEPDVYFTTSHFDGHAIVLVRLERISVADLQELIEEAWLMAAPKRLAKAYLEQHA
ncbi:MAG: MmcQ/YjbR family DNA-binding protein [Solirubrobacteraceae bacterium]|nr:MmcQ/YjbR family DNA-binding protein [Solirubrobacteraceae bacterium]